jgi:sugar/nucleoside kinase (ribokinase family)
MTARAIRRAPRQPGLVVLGDLLLEVAVTAARPVQVGTDVPGSVRVRRGGSAANVAVAFAGLGGRASLIGSVGRDGVGRRLVDALRDSGVTVHAVRVDAPTARLLDLIDRSGERSFVTERAAADGLRAADLRASWLRGARALHVPGYSLYNQPVGAAAGAAVGLLREPGRAQGSGSRAPLRPIVSVDLSSRAPMLAFGRQAAWQLIGELGPDVLFANASEGTALVRAGGLPKLLELASTVVIKEGPAGCRILWRGTGGEAEQLAVATTPIPAADTTGAGDAFAAGFLYALLNARNASALPVADGRWNAALLRRAALAGHRAAADLLRRPRPELEL